MFMRIQRSKEQALFFMILIPMFLLLIFLSLIFLARERTHNEEILEYQAGRLATDLLELSEAGIPEAIPGIRPDIVGFGVYSGEGRPSYRFGTAPESLPRDPAGRWAGEPLRYDGNRLVLIRPMGIPSSPGRGMMRGMMRDSKAKPPQGRVIYLELDIIEWQNMQLPLRYGFVLVPLLLVVLFTGVVILYRRNLAYRTDEEKNRRLVRLGEAARTLTHEIKNPLSTIRIQTATLKKVLPPDYTKNLTVIGEEVDRLGLLVDRVGEFLRNPAGEPESIDIDEFIRDLLARFPGTVVYLPEVKDSLTIRFDRHWFRTVLENLVKNALESLNSGVPGEEAPESEGPSVEVVVSADTRHIVIRVLDRGLGLPDGAGEGIFDPFFTTKTKGSGIGLAVSRRFVEAGGGTLDVYPRQGGGTEARIVLPREGKK